MPGPLRMGFHQLLISLHLEAHAKSRMMMQNEYIIPLVIRMGEYGLFRRAPGRDEQSPSAKMWSMIPSLENSVSIRPVISIEDNRFPLG